MIGGRGGVNNNGLLSTAIMEKRDDDDLIDLGYPRSGHKMENGY